MMKGQILKMNIAILLAGGIGSRMGNVDKPKQFIDVYGKPIIIYTLETFSNHPEIDYIAITCLEEWVEDLTILLRKYEIDKVKWIIPGGKTRQDSVYSAIKTISGECDNNDIIVVHDSVRPLISQKVISENILKAKKYGAVDTVIPSADTVVKSTDSHTITEIPQRSDYYLGQTPQTFKFSILRDAHDLALEQRRLDSTDDCQLVLNLGKDVHLVNGEKLNFKVTSFEDLQLFKAIVRLGKVEMLQ